jgi:hypothetical protein
MTVMIIFFRKNSYIVKLKGTIEEELGVKVLMEGTLEGVDFLKDKKHWCFFYFLFILDNLCSVAMNVKSNIAAPTLCIWTVASGRAEFCYLKPQVQIFSPDLTICSKLQVVAEILSRGGWIQPCARRSARVLEQPQDDGGGVVMTWHILTIWGQAKEFRVMQWWTRVP